jgi:hypothetical protein
MTSKKADLIDSFVFRKAKINTDKIRKKTDNNRLTCNETMSVTGRLQVGDITDIGPTCNRPVTETSRIDNNIDNPCYFISDRTAIILGNLILKEKNLFQRNQIAKQTGINVATVRQCIRMLVKYQFITKPERFRNHGSTYKLHSGICDQFMTLRWTEIINKYGDKPHINNLSPTCNRPVTELSSTCEESNFLYSSSTYNKTNTEIESIINTQPELAYWREKGLTKKMVLHWVERTGCSFEVIIRSLKYCKFELVDKGLEESKPVKSVFNWFFRVLEKTGGYPKPKGYKSFLQKQVETEREIMAEREKQANELKEIFERKKKAEQDTKFWAMMNEPEGETYKKTFAKLSPFEQKLKSGQAFHAAMQGAFEQMANSGA